MISWNLKDGIYDTFKHFGKTNIQWDWLVLSITPTQSGERKGWAQRFEFQISAQALYKFPESFHMFPEGDL